MPPLPETKSKFRPPAPTSFKPPRPVKPATHSSPPCSPQSTSSTSRGLHPLTSQWADLLDDFFQPSSSHTSLHEDSVVSKQEQQRQASQSNNEMANPVQTRAPTPPPLPLDDAWPVIEPTKKDEFTSSQYTHVYTDQDDEEDDFWRTSTQVDSKTNVAGAAIEAR